jgi:F0F1-type ATP synthase membrane subunit c/vacuolar-type H+-ATPase subunit K
MTYPVHQRTAQWLALLCAILVALTAAGSAMAQEKKVAQTNGVDNSKMGAYRALAQHMFADFQKGDLAAAAELGTVLERLWDKAEEYGGDTALAKTNRKLFDEIDKAMDQFITPITEAKGKPPDASKVKAAFNAYLEKLKQAD